MALTGLGRGPMAAVVNPVNTAGIMGWEGGRRMTLEELATKLNEETKRIGLKAGPILKMFDHNTCDGMRAVERFGRLGVEISFGWNCVTFDAPSVLKALSKFNNNVNASYEDVYKTVQAMRRR
jgi:hypothetical protein